MCMCVCMCVCVCVCVCARSRSHGADIVECSDSKKKNQNIRWESNAHGATYTSVLTDWQIKHTQTHTHTRTVYVLNACVNAGVLTPTVLFHVLICIQVSLLCSWVFVESLRADAAIFTSDIFRVGIHQGKWQNWMRKRDDSAKLTTGSQSETCPQTEINMTHQWAGTERFVQKRKIGTNLLFSLKDHRLL